MNSTVNQSNYFGSNERTYVTKQEYEEFKRQYIFDALRDLRFGQAFCNYFNIPNGTPLFYFKDMEMCERWIKDNYIR